VNGDGVDDVLVGKPGFKTIGHALLLSGRTGKLLYDFAAGSGDNWFGRALLGGRDVDGDGLVDVIVGAPKDVKKFKMSGRAFVFSGNDLFLQAQPSDPLAGDTLKLGTRGREPAAPAVLAIVGVNGSPTFTVVDAGLLDERSRRLLVAVVPPGLAGIAVDFQAFALDSRDGVIDSSVATVEFR
jgi:hypothetical protein